MTAEMKVKKKGGVFFIQSGSFHGIFCTSKVVSIESVVTVIIYNIVKSRCSLKLTSKKPIHNNKCHNSSLMK